MALFSNDGFLPADDDGFIPETGRNLPAAAAQPIQPDEDGFVAEEGILASARRMGVTPSNVLAATFRYGIPAAGGLGAGFATGNPVVGALAGGALASTGEAAAQFVERAAGERPDGVDGKEIASAGLIGAIPFGRLTQAGRAARYAKGATNRLAAAGTGALEGAGLGLASEGIKAGVEEGRLPTPQEAGTGALAGAALGGVLGRMTERKRIPPPPEKLDSAIAEVAKKYALNPDAVDYAEIGRQLASNDAEQLSLAGRTISKGLADQILKMPPEEVSNIFQGLEATKRGDKAFAQMFEFGRRAGLIPEDVLQRLAAAPPEASASFGGGVLSDIARVSKHLNLSKEAKDELQKIMGVAGKESTGWMGRFRTIEDTRKVVATQQLSTQVTNTVMNAARFNVDTVEAVVKRLLHGGQAGEVAGDIAKTAAGRALSPFRAGKSTKSVFKVFPELEKFTQHVPLIGESGVQNWATKASKLANLGLGEPLERMFRGFSFDANWREGLLQLGYKNPQEVFDNLKQFALKDPRIAEVIKGGIFQGLENTSAAPPVGELAKAFNAAWKSLPILSTVIPYPRFVTNAIKFISDFNPVGLFKLIGKTSDGELLASNPQAVERVLARVAVGTGLLGTAMAARNSEFAGDKWNEFKLPNGQIVDVQFMAPFSSFMFLGEAIKQMAEVGNLGRMNSEDFLQGVLSMSRVGGFGGFIFNFLQGRTDLDNMKGEFEQALGEYLSGFTVPLRTFKDYLSLYDPAEGESKDVRDLGVLGPVARNVPFATRGLPSRADPLTGETKTPGGEPIDFFGMRVPPEAVKQTTGLRISKRGPVEEAVVKAGREPFEFTPKLRAPIAEAREVQRDEERIKGRLTHEQLSQQILSPEFQALPQDQQNQIILERMGEIQRHAGQLALGRARGRDPLIESKIRIARQGSKAPSSRKIAAQLARDRELLQMGEPFGLGSR